nr:retrovirus-related Pol polyprotein from transposon TNT 1-94 [Tanacetum cinerariifolium]
MAAVNDVPQLVDKKGGMEPYYLKCIKDGPFQPKTDEGNAKPESQWPPDERRVVVQDQRMKSVIMSFLPDDIIEYVISCLSAKETWTDLVHSFEGLSDTKENKIMYLKLEYQPFRAKSTESLSQTYTRYKTLLNELANDGVNLSKYEINVGFVNSLHEKWLTFSQGLRNANHTQTLDLADIYGRFVYEDNLIQRREDHRTSDHEMYIVSLKRSENYKAQHYQYASSSKQIVKVKAKPFPPCTHCGFNDHRPDDYRNYPECEILIVLNKHDVPLIEDIEDPPDLIYTEGTHEQNVQDDQMITQPTDVPSGNNTKVLRPITEPLVLDVTHIAAKLRAASTSECLFADFLSKIEPKKVSEALKHPGWIDSIQVELNQFYGNKVWTLVPPPYRKIASNPKESHLTAMKRILKYLKGTPTLGLYYLKFSGFDLKGYLDSEYAGCNMDRKSTSVEAEYVAASRCRASILWMKSQLTDNDNHYKMVPIFCDNTSAIAISNNPVHHSRTKHIDIRYHFIKDHILIGDIKFHFIPTEYQLADIFTKPLDVPTFTRLKAELGMEFWSTAVAFNPFPSTDEPEQRPLKEFPIKFLVLNGQQPLTLDFKTFCSLTGLDYNNGKYVDDPTPEVLGGNYSSTIQVNSIQQLLAYSLITGTEVDIGEIIYSDLVTKLLNKSRLKYVSYPRFISCALHVLLAHMIAINNQRDLVSLPPLVAKPKKRKSQTVAPTLPKSQGPEALGALFKKRIKPKAIWEQRLRGNKPPTDMEPQNPTDVDLLGTGTKYQEDQTQSSRLRDQTDKIMEASTSSLDRSSTTISDLYKGPNVITELLKDISNAVKDDPAINQKINEATKTFTRISSNVIKVPSLVNGFDFFALLYTVQSIQDHGFKQEASFAVWMKTSANMAWNLGSRMTGPSSAPSGSVTLTLALTDIQENVEGENTNTIAIEKPPSHTKGETDEPRLAISISLILSAILPPTQAQPITSIIIHLESSQATLKIEKGKWIATESNGDPSKKLVKASSDVRPNPDEPVKVEFIINRRIVYLTEQEIQDY